MTKTADVPAIPAAGGVVAHTVVATNVGNGPYTAAAPAWFYGHYGAALDDADADLVLLGADRGVRRPAERPAHLDRAARSGASVTFTVQMTVQAAP